MSEETLREIFAKNLRHYMEDAGKNQVDLRKFMNVSSATASDWCTGRKMPRADKIQSLAKWLGINIGNLMEEQDSSNVGYYTNPETAQVAQKIFENKELRALFDVQQDMEPDDLQALHSMALALKRKERGNDDDTGC